MIKKISLLISVAILSFTVGYFVFAWTEPSKTPPGGNVPPPVRQWEPWDSDFTVRGGDITVNKEGNYSSIYFPAQTNDPGYIQHYESNNTGRLYLMPGDDWSSSDAVIVKGTDESWAHELRTDGWLGVASGIYDRTDGTLNVSDSLSVSGNLNVAGKIYGKVCQKVSYSMLKTTASSHWEYCPNGYYVVGLLGSNHNLNSPPENGTMICCPAF